MSNLKSTKNIPLTDDEIILNSNDLVANVFDSEEVSACVDKINDLPDSIDMNRVLKLKQSIESGDYNWDQNLDAAVDNIIKESSDKHPISYPIFD